MQKMNWAEACAAAGVALRNSIQGIRAGVACLRNRIASGAEEQEAVKRQRIWVGLCVAVGLALFYFGGWSVQFGGWPQGYFSYVSDSFAFGHGFLIRINTGWYGMYMDARFFDAPIIQWGMLWMGFSTLGYALKEFLGVQNEDDED